MKIAPLTITLLVAAAILPQGSATGFTLTLAIALEIAAGLGRANENRTDSVE